MKKLKLLSLLLCLVVQFAWCQSLVPDLSGIRQYADAERFVYWFDSDTATNSIDISDNPFEIDVSHLSVGFHTFYACLADSLSNYSPAVSSMFFCQMQNDSLGQNKIAYWFDNESDFTLIDAASDSFKIDVSDLSIGFHSLHCAIANGGTIVSPAKSILFNNNFVDPSSVSSIIYWFDDKETMLVDTVINLHTMIDVSDLAIGFHTIHAYTLLDNGIATTTVSRLFMFEDSIVFDKAVYWFDSDDSLYVADYSDNSFQIDVTSLSTGYHTLHCLLADMTKGITTAPDSTVFSIKVCAEADSSFVVASVCQGEFFSWRGRNYSEPGIYYDSLITDYSCDSVFVLTLTVNPSYLIEESIAIGQGESYSWHGRFLTNAGVYYDSLQSIAGCDSVYRLTLTVNPSYLFEDEESICQGESFNWRNRTLTEAGIYFDSLTTQQGEDSVYKLTLTVYPSFSSQMAVSICQGESYLWRGQYYSQAGTYIDTFQTIHGCDSIYKLTLTVNPSYLIEESMAIGQGESYSWHGRILTYAGVYYDSLQSIAGCDSVYKLTLTVNPSYFFEDEESICQGESFNWRNRTLTEAGIYFDSLTTQQGEDSVYKLTLTVYPSFSSQMAVSICQGESYLWRGQYYSQADTYIDTFQTIHGCDSIYKLTLTVNPSYLIEESMAIGQGESYSWHGRFLTNAGVYYDSLQSIAGCDSVYRLTLTVNPSYLFEDEESICQGDSFNWRNRTLTEAGIYFDSLTTQQGEDSVYKLKFTVYPSFSSQMAVSICQGESYLWRGQYYSQADTYIDTFQTIHGCDSIHELILSINPIYLMEDTMAICQGEIFNWHGNNYTEPGVYYDSLWSLYGCDSIHKLTLIVHPTYTFEESDTICQGDVYHWHNRSLSAAGVYYDSLTTLAGCDSIYKLTLVVNSSYIMGTEVSICQGDTYSWRGNTYSDSGVYYDSLQTFLGCDSIYKLTLTVNPTYFIEDNVTICQNDDFQWRGNTYSESGIYYDSLQTLLGCDSVYKLTLKVYPTYLVNDTATLPSDGSGYLWRGQSYSEAGDYTDSYKTVSGCDSVYTLHLIDSISTGVDEVSGMNAVKVYVVPNPVRPGMVAHVYGEFGEVETVEILNNFGQVVDRFTPSSYPIEIDGLEVDGLYYVRIINRSGEIFTEKLLVK